MRPVVLTVLDGKNFILGTFDTTNFQDWWKSEPFPGAIDTIGKPTHVYGQYHVCICKMSNGTYSIYRTKNMGKSWEPVYNTAAIIYSINVIDYGWVIASTSTGWIESTLDSGKTWTALSSFAPGCKAVINIGDDILFAHDGNNVWRSVDYGETWKVVLSNSGWTSNALHPEWSTCNFKWLSYSEPALAGINQTVFAGFGPYLIISEDLGETWTTHPSGWNNSIFNMPTWGNVSFSPQAGNRILQIVLTDGLGSNTTQSAIMIRSLVGSSVKYLYSGPLSNASYSAGWYFSEVFALPNNGSGTITAYNVLRPGSPTYDILATITAYDSSNNPIIKNSTDGGKTWTNISTTGITVYEGDPTQEIISGIGQQTFDEEYYSKYSWSGAACHNSGRYIEEYNKTVRGISHDMDLLTTFRKPKSLSYDTVIKKLFSSTYGSDILNKKKLIKTYGSDSLLKKTTTKTYLHGMLLQDSFESTYDLYLALASRIPLTYDGDSLLQKTILSRIYYDVLLFDSPTKTYGMETKLIDDHIEQIMNSIERYSPQSPDIRYPDIPYVPYDSRTQNVTL